MAVFKCKMCGGSLEIQNETVAVCEYCGTRQTLPRSRDEALANLFNRANNLRMKCEFDKAQQLYEKILEADDTEAEAHWGVVLCKYGIEYVEDPKTFDRIPTCHRASYQSIVSDPEYLAALEHGDEGQRRVYQAEAEAIDKIQRNILQIVKNEAPFDVFICYKETDASGARTQDSVIANDIYYQLTQAGLKVFYAAITLEDKLGQEYEPYIFAALNSAKVMLVIGTKAEYFDAVWVKNEWSRFLNLMKTDRTKLLIPCYRDMDAYDLPGEFSHLQAQDMSKIGFINDVTRGIRKVLEKPAAASAAAPSSGAATNTAPLLERAYMFLEDKNWESADEYCEKVLDLDPKNAGAYLGKLLAELKIPKVEALRDAAEPFGEHPLYQKVIRFADASLAETLKGYNAYIGQRNEEAAKEAAYQEAKTIFEGCYNSANLHKAADTFGRLKGYKDSDELHVACREKAKNKQKEEDYDKASEMMDMYSELSLENAIFYFQRTEGWRDSEEKIAECRYMLDKLVNARKQAQADEERRKEELRLKREEEQRQAAARQAAQRRKRKILGIVKIVAIILGIAAVVGGITYGVIYLTKIAPQMAYEKGIAAFEKGDYNTAYGIFTKLNDYKDSIEYAGKALYPMQAEILAQSDLQIGDTVLFGHYYQDSSDSLQEVEWIVLAREGTRVQLCSKYILDNEPFHRELTEGITWANCSLREWMNGEFMDLAFSEKHKAMITPTLVDGVTNDQLYLFTSEEVRTIFSEEDRKLVSATSFSQQANTQQGYGNWWMRSMTDAGSEHMLAIDGYATPYSMTATSGVRPVMWIDLSLLDLSGGSVSE